MAETRQEEKMSTIHKSRGRSISVLEKKALFEKEATEKGKPELVKCSTPWRGFPHKKGKPELAKRSSFSRVFPQKKVKADDMVWLSSEFEKSQTFGEDFESSKKHETGLKSLNKDMKQDDTYKEKSKLLRTGTTKNPKSKYADLAVFRQPVCLVQNDENGKLSLERRITTEIATIDDPLNVIAIAGPYRSGKSYLLNRLANAQRGFRIGNTTAATTKGIWAWCLEHPERKGEVLMLLDSEGIGDVDKGDEENDHNILSLMTLLSGTFIYNLIGFLDQKLLKDLSCVAHLSEKIVLSNTVSQDDLKFIPEIGFFFPSFVLCLRDFFLQIAGGRTPDDYFETCLQVKKGKNEKSAKLRNAIRVAILGNFKSRKCFTFERPVSGRAQLARLEYLKKSDLNKTFLDETQEFVDYIFGCKPKKLMDGSVLNGRMFSSLAEQYIGSIQSGQLPCIDDALTKMSIEENTIAVKHAVEMFKQQIESIEFPLPDDFQLRYMQAQIDALESFRKMAVLDDMQAFQKQAESEMDKIKRTVEERNRTFIEGLCSQEFQRMYDELIRPKVINGTYAKSGGYKLYTDDFVRFRENAQQCLPRVDSNLIQISAVHFEEKYRKQDEEILEKADMSELQIKEKIQEQHAKLAQEKSKLLQEIELKDKKWSTILELFKEELKAQKEQEQQSLVLKYEQLVQDWQNSKEDLKSQAKEEAACSIYHEGFGALFL